MTTSSGFWCRRFHAEKVGRLSIECGRRMGSRVKALASEITSIKKTVVTVSVLRQRLSALAGRNRCRDSLEEEVGVLKEVERAAGDGSDENAEEGCGRGNHEGSERLLKRIRGVG